jgi:Trypsin-like peptidase domain
MNGQMLGLATISNPPKAVLRVGDGRGFVVKHGRERIVVTAAHCLPHTPKPHLFSYPEERTFQNLLGPLDGRATVWAECIFVDTIFDVAVLCSPDDQALYQQAESYENLITDMSPLVIADAPKQKRRHIPELSTKADIRVPAQGFASVLSLDGAWIECSITRTGSLLSLDPPEIAVCGMSGSPVISAEGRAIGLLSTNNMCPVLNDSLPRRITRPSFVTVES